MPTPNWEWYQNPYEPGTFEHGQWNARYQEWKASPGSDPYRSAASQVYRPTGQTPTRPNIPNSRPYVPGGVSPEQLSRYLENAPSSASAYELRDMIGRAPRDITTGNSGPTGSGGSPTIPNRSPQTPGGGSEAALETPAKPVTSTIPWAQRIPAPIRAASRNLGRGSTAWALLENQFAGYEMDRQLAHAIGGPNAVAALETARELAAPLAYAGGGPMAAAAYSGGFSGGPIAWAAGIGSVPIAPSAAINNGIRTGLPFDTSGYVPSAQPPDMLPQPAGPVRDPNRPRWLPRSPVLPTDSPGRPWWNPFAPRRDSDDGIEPNDNPNRAPWDVPNAGASGGSGPNLGGDVEGPPPFEGGQGYGVGYYVTVQLTDKTYQGGYYQFWNGAHYFFTYVVERTFSNTRYAVGPISGLSGRDRDYPGQNLVTIVGQNGQTWDTDLGRQQQPAQSNSLLADPKGAAIPSSVYPWDQNASITNVVRVDGQPDTSGNPPGPILPPETAPAERPTPTRTPRTPPVAPPVPPRPGPDDSPPATPPAAIPPPIPTPQPDIPQPFAPPTDEPYTPPRPGNPPQPGPQDPPAADPSNTPGPLGQPSKQPGPTGQPGRQTGPTGSPTADKTIDNYPGPWEIETPGGTIITKDADGNIEISQPLDNAWDVNIPSAITGGVAVATGIAIGTQALPKIVDKIVGWESGLTNAEQGGNKPPEKPRVAAPPNCGCNAAILDQLGRNQRQLLDQLPGLGAEAMSTAAILDALQKIMNAIGVAGLPASVPANLAKPAGGTKTIGSLAELHLWQTEQLDGLVGQFPQKTTVSTPNGNVDLNMPNVSETLSEILGMLMGLSITGSQTLHTASRTLMQAGSATQQAHLAGLYARANADFLGYQAKPSAVDIPLSYSPGKDPWDGFLGEGSQKIKGWENTDSQNIKNIFAELLHAASIIRAVYWRQIDPRQDIKRQIQQNLRDQSDYVDEEAARKGESSDWKEYLNRVERGFNDQTGDQSPYGRNPEEGPKIRDLTAGEDDQ